MAAQHSFQIIESHKGSVTGEPLHALYQLLEPEALFLELEKILFQMLPVCHMTFQSSRPPFHYEHGKNGKEEKAFILMHQGKSLGVLKLQTMNPLCNEDTMLLHEIMTQLIYPLKNALKYKQALLESRKDPLTDIGNRYAWQESYPREFFSAKRYHHPLSLILMDLDRFKVLNDTKGHLAGDKVIQAVGLSLSKLCRGSDSVYRIGGEEFMILCPYANQEGAYTLAERMRSHIQALEVPYHQDRLRVTISCGIATLCNKDTPESLFEKADGALYQAKRQGKNKIILDEDY